MFDVIIATVTAGAAGVASWYVDQQILRCRTVFRAGVATALMVVSTWIVAVIQVAFWLGLPGAYGPVQYWHGDPGAIDFMMGPRTWALFLTLAGLVLVVVTLASTVVSLFFPAEHSRWYRLLMPLAACTVYVLAYDWFFRYEFFPSA